MSPVSESVRAILAAQMDIDEDKIDENTDIMEDLGADSLDVVELMMSVEEQFGVTIEEEEMSDFRTVGDIVRYIEENS